MGMGCGDGDGVGGVFAEGEARWAGVAEFLAGPTLKPPNPPAPVRRRPAGDARPRRRATRLGSRFEARSSRLKVLGVRLAIDDFGTGYSSLACLQRFPVDIIKIDKTFVRSVAVSGGDAVLASTIVMPCDAVGLRTLAEGIETENQRDMLTRLG